jgi:hypothetical protein
LREAHAYQSRLFCACAISLFFPSLASTRARDNPIMLVRALRRFNAPAGARLAVRRTIITDAQAPSEPIESKDLRGLSPDALETLTGIPKDQLSREVLIFRPRANHMQSGYRVRNSAILMSFDCVLCIYFSEYFQPIFSPLRAIFFEDPCHVIFFL